VAASVADAALAYYAAHDVLTDPGAHARRLDALPAALPALHAALDGLLVHVWRVRASHPQLFAPVGREVFVRHTSRLLEALLRFDPAPLSAPRPVERRVVVDCRHFAVVLCAALRHQGVPARPRCGFATYLEDGVAVDHWACEVWDAARGRWVLEDADKRRHDVPRDEFLTGASVWQRCRSDPAFAERIGFDARTRGRWVARANLVRDVAALNGFPSVSGDCWGLGRAPDAALTPADVATLDRVADLAERAPDDGAFAALRHAYETTAGLRVPDLLPNADHFNGNVWRTVAWRTEP
jgi:hypothetical protein